MISVEQAEEILLLKINSPFTNYELKCIKEVEIIIDKSISEINDLDDKIYFKLDEVNFNSIKDVKSFRIEKMFNEIELKYTEGGWNTSIEYDTSFGGNNNYWVLKKII